MGFKAKLIAEKLPSNYFFVQRTMFRTFGIDFDSKDESFLYNCYSFFLLTFFCIPINICMGVDIINNFPDMMIIVGIASYFVSSMPGCIKFIILFINRKRIGRMLDSLHEAPFAPNELRGGKEEEIILKSLIRKTNFQNIIYYTSISGTLLFGAINSVYYRLRYWHDSSKWMMPYAPTMPWFDYTSSPTFEYGALFQFISIVTLAIQIANSFSMMTCILAHISIQFVILGNAFRNLKQRAENLQKLDNDNSKPFDYYVDIIFRETWKHHLQIFELANEMERLCCVIILAIMISSILLMCFVMYCCLVYPNFSLLFMQNAFYCLIILCHVGMYCYWGNEVSEASFGVAQAVAEIDWIDLPGNVSKSLILVIQRCQKPLYITAGKFFPLSMTSFMSIMKGSISFLMLLRQSDESEN